MIRQGAQRRSESFRGQIRLRPALMQKQIAAVLNNELLTRGTQGNMPTDPLIAILKGITRRTPCKDRHPFAIADIRLAKEVARWLHRAEIV